MKKSFILALLVLISGCSSYMALPMDTSRLAQNRMKKQVKKGLIIAAEDYSNPRISRRYFYRDILGLGYIPIYICVGNHSDYEFTIRTKDILFRFEDGTPAQAASVKEVIDRAQASKFGAILAFPLAILPGILIWNSISSANDQLDQDYSLKAFRDSHILENDNIFGFLFFKIPRGKSGKSIKDATLEIKASKKAAKGEMAETIKFIVSIDPQ